MSPQITFKSNEDKAPQAEVDAAGHPVPQAPRLCDAVRIPYVPSHGTAPSAMPEPPAGLEDLGPAAAVRVVGPEREKWLQGMQSNDISAAPYGGAVAAAFLGGKGRLIALALLWRRRDEVIVSTGPDRLDALRMHLDKLLIMEDCEMQEAPGLRRLRYWPANVAPGMVPGHLLGSAQPLGFELLLPEAEAQSLLETLRERPRPDLAEAWRIAAGVPKWGAELDEETTPIEAGLDPLLSFSKGCYVGQEVVAMATYRGRVAWNLVRLEVAGAAPPPGAKLGAGGKGRVTSSTQVGGVALLLGYVHRESIVPGTAVPLEDGRAAYVLGLPHGSLPGAGVCA
ncbi:MAG: CAF17-like 4Fe-4S cluster assembly/insertion protein YgfZ [Myxococcales bacterium]